METGGSLDKEIRGLARALYHAAAQHKPSLFEPQDWIGRMIDWSLEDKSLRVALFRFVDVLPSLNSAAGIGRHLREYFARVDHARHAGWLVAPVVRHNVVRLARRFIVEEDNDALPRSWKDSGKSLQLSLWMWLGGPRLVTERQKPCRDATQSFTPGRNL